MIFGLFAGREDHAAAFRETAARHAAAVAMRAAFQTHPVAAGGSLCLATLVHGEDDVRALSVDEGRLRFNVAPGARPAGPGAALDPRAPAFEVDRRDGTIRASAGPTALEPLLWTADARGRVVSNDLRLLDRWQGFHLDPVAVYALFLYGAIPAPHTLSTRASRLPPGASLRWERSGAEPACERFFRAAEQTPRRAELPPADRVAAALDDVLRPVPADPILFFSGGVDSALLALRMKALGRSDVRLVNYTFGPDDPEAGQAERVAASLGMDLHRVRLDVDRVPDVLDTLGRDYPYPFSDFGCITTNLMVRETARRMGAGATAIEGTGADGAFGFEPKYREWERAFAIPRPARVGLAALYRGLGLWRLDSTRLERLGRALRKSAWLPLRHAAISQNPLEGIAYRIPAPERRALQGAMREHVDGLSEGSDEITRLSILDLVHVCSAQFAAKSYEPIQRAGLRPVYPYLEPGMIRESVALSWDEKCPGGEAKGLLKELLVRGVPHELVYRPKVGFAPPLHRIFQQPDVAAFVRDCVHDPGNPLRALVRRRTVDTMLRRGVEGRPLSHGVHAFLWALVFTSAWLKQTRA